LVNLLAYCYPIQPTTADTTTLSHIVTINADGTITPEVAPIQRQGDLYTLTGDIFFDFEENEAALLIERDNIILDGLDQTMSGIGLFPGIILMGRDNVTIRNLTITEFGFTIKMVSCTNCKILYNDMPNPGRYTIGLSLQSSDYNVISSNNITDNYYCGLSLLDSSHNIVSSNLISDNNNGGLMIGFSDENIFTENIIHNNFVELTSSYENKFYHNQFIGFEEEDYLQQIFISPSDCNTVWDDGYPSGGNYWMYYNGVDTDNDRIGDSSYVVNSNNQDRYPLMTPWTSWTSTIYELIERVRFFMDNGRIRNNGW
jgi:parallel beta-helix repeat protein